MAFAGSVGNGHRQIAHFGFDNLAPPYVRCHLNNQKKILGMVNEIDILGMKETLSFVHKASVTTWHCMTNQTAGK